MGETAYQESAGGVLLDAGRVLLIRTRTRAGQPVWTFPKGRIRRGEARWEAALREVREETGYLCRLRSPLQTTSYAFRGHAASVQKTVHWYLLKPIRKAGVPDPREVEAADWFPLDEAFGKLRYDSDVGLLRAAVEAHEG